MSTVEPPRAASGGVERVAQALLRARGQQQPADAQALADALQRPQDAYAVQRQVAAALGEPAVPRFWKSGGPSRTATLTHAPLPERGVWPSGADARGWPFHLRLIEAEVALRIRSSVTAQQAQALTHEDAAGLVDAMAVSIEVVDSRWAQGVDAPPLLKLADLQSHGALVLGEWQAFAPRDWSRQACEVRIGKGPPDRRVGTHALQDPLWLLPHWLRHATREGQTVPAGSVVTTGTWCGMLPAQAGDRVQALFEGIGEAWVQL